MDLVFRSLNRTFAQMEQKKIPQVDLDHQRTTGFLLGLVLVLALLFVSLEWNSMPNVETDEDMDISELVHEDELVPLSIEQQMAEMPPARAKAEESEQLRVVDDNVELAHEEKNEQDDTDGDKNGEDDSSVPQQVDTEDPKVLTPVGIDPNNNPLMFRVVEDLPQFPGGAVELMKWLTRNLAYPKVAQSRKTQGKVVAFFYVEKDGKITGITIHQSLSKECDDEALRVLKQMPRWKPGIQNGKPCRTKVCIPIVFKL